MTLFGDTNEAAEAKSAALLLGLHLDTRIKFPSFYKDGILCPNDQIKKLKCFSHPLNNDTVKSIMQYNLK